ncbi:hypothetical protein CLOBY_00360 [Clostridium saccharobutylicum]|uniref:hypothetical protein n=1 Tax=Clostridium saccharobutylicum TaxID=169679 RepID=UPI000983F574|nr:hypothetical protein [Clostridium saccharobutylicum]AQS07987.1 hypothetical protein CLOBY_00360 [Clostridium saccharobutylicum]MBC2436964.1 hypothetical protein [Clostridium saccharobutylicum]NSB89315.1 hypothetical protein [Clostridium saccharobutylicum]NYC29695.1 hypothetical protein [Clostridium saccharobutylicum]OOM17318.1 hypothetical protein CLSAB_17430 [Clostridium saccharobutylicum]
MNKKVLIAPTLSMMLLFNAIPVFASESVSSTNNTTNLSADDLKEPEIGTTTSDDMTNSYYVWDKLNVRYEWHNNQWLCFIGGEENNGYFGYASDAETPYDPYVVKSMPIIGKEGQCITDSYWIYMGRGLYPEKILTKLTQLEAKVNRASEN